MSLFHDECRRFQMNSRTFSTLRIEFTFIPRLELMSQLFRSYVGIPFHFAVTLEITINCKSSWQRRMGVEPTGDRAERPPSRFEDGETHRGPYTSTCVAVFCHSHLLLSSSCCFSTKCSDALYIYLGQTLHHQLCFV